MRHCLRTPLEDQGAPARLPLHGYLQGQVSGHRLVTLTDSFPVLVCRFARAPDCRRLAPEAAYGYDELVEGIPSVQTFYGLRAHVAVFWPGVIRNAELAPGDVSDVAMAPEVLYGVRGWALADRNRRNFCVWSPELTEKLKEGDVALLAPFKQKSHEKTLFPPALTRMRRRVETVIGQLVGRFSAKRCGRWTGGML